MTAKEKIERLSAVCEALSSALYEKECIEKYGIFIRGDNNAEFTPKHISPATIEQVKRILIDNIDFAIEIILKKNNFVP